MDTQGLRHTPGSIAHFVRWAVAIAGAVAAGSLCPAAWAADAGAATENTQSVNAPETATQESTSEEEIVITGVRRSLEDAATTKRTSVNFSDSIFAEDIGKFSDNDIAEALNRAPGVLLTRDINGNGIDISIRGLGPSFT